MPHLPSRLRAKCLAIGIYPNEHWQEDADEQGFCSQRESRAGSYLGHHHLHLGHLKDAQQVMAGQLRVLVIDLVADGVKDGLALLLEWDRESGAGGGNYYSFVNNILRSGRFVLAAGTRASFL